MKERTGDCGGKETFMFLMVVKTTIRRSVAPGESLRLCAQSLFHSTSTYLFMRPRNKAYARQLSSRLTKMHLPTTYRTIFAAILFCTQGPWGRMFSVNMRRAAFFVLGRAVESTSSSRRPRWVRLLSSSLRVRGGATQDANESSAVTSVDPFGHLPAIQVRRVAG